MTLEQKINSVIGLNYDYQKANCWDLVIFLNEDAPKIDEAHESFLTTMKKFKEYEKEYKGNFNSVMFPKDGDIILLGKRNCFDHAGIFYNDGIVHASMLGVIWQNLTEIKRDFRLLKAYQCK